MYLYLLFIKLTNDIKILEADLKWFGSRANTSEGRLPLEAEPHFYILTSEFYSRIIAL